MEVQNRKNERPIQDEDHLDIEDLDESKTNPPVFLAIHKQQS
jgi:hypothetical protein